MTVYYPDAASQQAGISFADALVAMVKATEGTTYTNPDFINAKNRAATSGSYFCAYHFLWPGNLATQAQHAYNVVGKSIPLMLDVEQETDAAGQIVSAPTVADVAGFVAAYRELGGTVFLMYMPKWYWEQNLNSAPLAPLVSLGMLLVSSDYATYTDADTGAGWLPYGGMAPTVWQYTDSVDFNGDVVDFNAFRGHYAGKQDDASVTACLAEFKALTTTGKYPPAPVPTPPNWTYGPPANLRISVGRTTFKTTFTAPVVAKGLPEPSIYHVYLYDTTNGAACSTKTIVSSYPRVASASPFQGGGLVAKHTYTVHITAEGPNGTRVRPNTYATAVFSAAQTKDKK